MAFNALMAGDNKTKPLDSAERAEAKRLKTRFNLNKRRLALTQERLGDLMGVGQSAISHWLNGTKRISDLTLIRLCTHIDCDPEEVRPGVLDRLPVIDPTKSLSDRALMLARQFDDLSEADQQLLLSVLARVLS